MAGPGYKHDESKKYDDGYGKETEEYKHHKEPKKFDYGYGSEPEEYKHEEEYEHKSYKPTEGYEFKLYEDKDDDEHYGEHRGEKNTNALVKPILCPNLKHCKRLDLGRAKFELIGPSGTVCVFDRTQTSSCNLAVSGGFCFLEGQFFGPDEIVYKETDKVIKTFLKHC